MWEDNWRISKSKKKGKRTERVRIILYKEKNKEREREKEEKKKKKKHQGEDPGGGKEGDQGERGGSDITIEESGLHIISNIYVER